MYLCDSKNIHLSPLIRLTNVDDASKVIGISPTLHCFTETSLQLSWLTNFETGSECEKFLSLKPIISAKFKLIERNLKWSRSMNIVLVWQFVLTNEIWAKLKLKPAFSSSEYMKQCHETSPEKVSRTRCKLVALSDKFCMLTWKERVEEGEMNC